MSRYKGTMLYISTIDMYGNVENMPVLWLREGQCTESGQMLLMWSKQLFTSLISRAITVYF